MDRKEAIEIVRSNFPNGRIQLSEALMTLIPELKESKDEKIRKALINVFSTHQGYEVFFGASVEDILAWLEKQGEPQDKGKISDGYHTFNELYYYRMLYNAAFFNMLPKEWVHKSKKHHDGEECFGGGWFIVMDNLPTGQISNHYELKDWDLFQIPEKEVADKWDGHSPQEAADRLHKYLLEKQGEKSNWKPSKDAMSALYSLVYITDKMDDKKDEALTKLYQDLKREYFNGKSIENMFSLEKQEEDKLTEFEKEVKCIIQDIKNGDAVEDYKFWSQELLDLAKRQLQSEIDEQNPTDKVEPKYKAGDWIQIEHGNIMQILDVSEFIYTILSCYGDMDTRLISEIDPVSHIWTIQDAKDGDVLVCDSEYHGQEIGIVKKYVGKQGGCDTCFDTYCFVDWNGIFRIGEYMGSRNIYPSTKEQRDKLEKEMVNAGYKWDAEKKELNKIDDKNNRYESIQRIQKIR